MTKTVYIETSVFSVLTTDRADPASLYRKEITTRWWEEQRTNYDLYVSQAVVDELSAGFYARQEIAIALAEPIRKLTIDEEVRSIARVYVSHKLMPDSATGDALHLALVCAKEVDYLLTWNIRHLANPNKIEHLTLLNRRLGLLTPMILSPDQLWMENTP